MKRYVCAIGFVLVFVCAWAGRACALPVSGRVVDYRARPVAGAEVVVCERYNLARDSYGRIAGPVVRTDERGGFSLEVETASQYDTFIVARKEGLAPAWDGLNYSLNTLGKGHFLLVLEKPCTLTGVVVDDSGKPAAGARVQAVPKTSYMSRLSQRPMYGPAEWFTTETDEQGVFRFDAFAGDVSADFRIQAPGWNCTYTFTTHYQNCCGFEVGRPDIRLVLPAEHRVQGCVVEGDTGRGAAGVELVVTADRDREDVVNRYLARTVMTGADGTFTCAGLPEGKNRIALAVAENETPAWVAEPVVVDVAADRVTEDVRVVLSKGGIIEADVREQGADRPVGRTRVRAYGKQSSAVSLTDDSGRAGFRLRPGEYEVHAGGEAYLWWQTSEPVMVTAGQTTHLDISLDRSPTIRGAVTDPDGQAAEDVLVTVHPFGDHVYTQAQGRFTAQYDQRRAEQGLCIIARDRTRSLAGVTHAARLQEPIELSLRPALTVTGRVTDPSGQGIPAARASLCVHLWNCLSLLGEEVLTDAQGRFEFRAIAPVQEPFDYRLSVHAAGYAPRTYQRIAIGGEPGSPVDVGAVELPPADLSISGVVVDANGAPAPRVILFLRGADGGEQPDKAAATDEQGRFRIRRICKGPIRLQVNFSSSPGGSGSLQAEAGDQDLRAVLGQKIIHERFTSLAGRPLPDTKPLLDLPPERTQGKPILLCFFDMEQRPSRRCIDHLSERSDVLSQKGIIVAAIQAGSVDDDVWKTWAAKHNAQLPRGRIKEDAEKVRRTWGVQSLPWLILTDTRHVVRAEGFAIDELDAKMREEKDHEEP